MTFEQTITDMGILSSFPSSTWERIHKIKQNNKLRSTLPSTAWEREQIERYKKMTICNEIYIT